MYTLQVEEMSCNHCVGSVTKAVQALDAAATVTVDLKTKAVQVGHTSIPLEKIVAAIDEAGYPVTASAAH